MADQNWFNPNTYMDMFKAGDMTKFFDMTKVPQVDANAFTEVQNKNMQAFMDANCAAAEGYKTVFAKQMEIAQANFASMQAAVQELSGQPMSADAVEARVEAARTAFEKAIEDFKGLTETARTANEDAFTILQLRFQESVTEFQAAAQKAADQAAESVEQAAEAAA